MMKTEPFKLTIVSHQGAKEYKVGQVVNSLTIDKIVDCSLEYESSCTIIYRGYTVDKQIVFECYNAPVEVEFYNPEYVY